MALCLDNLMDLGPKSPGPSISLHTTAALSIGPEGYDRGHIPARS